MPVALRRDREKSTRAQGADSLVPGSQPVPTRPKLTRKPRCQTPAPQSSQVNADAAEEDSESSEDCRRGPSVTRTSPLEPGSEDYESAAESPTLDKLDKASRSKKKDKRKTVIQDTLPTPDELRAVRTTNQITVDKRVIYTERWVWNTPQFEY